MKIDDENIVELEIYTKLEEAEKDVREGNVYDANEVFAALKKKYFGK